MKFKCENSYSRKCMYTGPPTTTTQKPIVFCSPMDAGPLPAWVMEPFITIIECGSTQYCKPEIGNYLGYL